MIVAKLCHGLGNAVVQFYCVFKQAVRMGGELQIKNSADASSECPIMWKVCKKIVRQRELVIEDTSLLGY